MGRDYKIGLILGLAPVFVALIWIATRPSLSPEARMQGTPEAAPRQALSGGAPPSSVGGRPPADSIALLGESPRTLPPGVILSPAPASTTEPATQGSAPPDQSQSQTNVTPAPPMPDLTIYELPEKIKTTRFHIVRRGETLSGISQQYYDSPNKWQKILQANQGTVKDANKIAPGTKLIIPD